MTAAACYVQHPGDAEFRALAVDVLRIRRGRIIEFDRAVFPSFGLPETVAAGDER